LWFVCLFYKGVSGMGRRSFVRSIARAYGIPVMTLDIDDNGDAGYLSKLSDAAALGCITLLHTRSSLLFRPSVYVPLIKALTRHNGGSVVLVVDCDRLIPGDDDSVVPDALLSRATIDIHINMLDSGHMRTLLTELISSGVVSHDHVIPSYEHAVSLSLFLSSLRAQTVALRSPSPLPQSPASSSTSSSSVEETSTASGSSVAAAIAGSTSSIGGPVVWIRPSSLL
jgi:hypothetical protein